MTDSPASLVRSADERLANVFSQPGLDETALRKQFGLAEQELLRALELDSRNAAALTGLATVVARRDGNNLEAVALCQRAIEIDAGSYDAWIIKAGCLADLDKLETARECLDTAIRSFTDAERRAALQQAKRRIAFGVSIRRIRHGTSYQESPRSFLQRLLLRPPKRTVDCRWIEVTVSRTARLTPWLAARGFSVRRERTGSTTLSDGETFYHHKTVLTHNGGFLGECSISSDAVVFRSYRGDPDLNAKREEEWRRFEEVLCRAAAAWRLDPESSAVLDLIDRAESGDAQAQFEVAKALHQRDETCGHKAEIERLLRAAGAAGHAEALGMLGSLLRDRDDFAGAVSAFEKAVGLGNRRASVPLGMIYLSPTSKQRDLTKAYQCFRAGSTLGDGMALANLGIMHANGIGVPRDLCKAAWLLVAATRCGNQPAAGMIKELAPLLSKVPPPELERLNAAMTALQELDDSSDVAHIGSFVVNRLESLAEAQ